MWSDIRTTKMQSCQTHADELLLRLGPIETLPDIGINPYAIGSFVQAKLYMSTEAPPSKIREVMWYDNATYRQIDRRELFY
jgi:hypothetical protein